MKNRGKIKNIFIIMLVISITLLCSYKSYAYFVATSYQNNRITIKAPEIEAPTYDFVTTCKSDNSDFTKFTIYLKDYFDVDNDFKFDIEKKYGYFKDKPLIESKYINDDEIHLNFKQYIDLEKISKELPSKDRLEVMIKYKKDEEIYTKLYSLQFTRKTIDNSENEYDKEYLNIHFNEINY